MWSEVLGGVMEELVHTIQQFVSSSGCLLLITGTCEQF